MDKEALRTKILKARPINPHFWKGDFQKTCAPTHPFGIMAEGKELQIAAYLL